MKKQIELLKKYNVTNYVIENGKITINGYLDLEILEKTKAYGLDRFKRLVNF